MEKSQHIFDSLRIFKTLACTIFQLHHVDSFMLSDQMKGPMHKKIFQVMELIFLSECEHILYGQNNRVYLKSKTKRQTRDTTTIQEADDVLALTILTVNIRHNVTTKNSHNFVRSEVITQHHPVYPCLYMSVDQQNMTNYDYYNIKCICKKKKICHILNIRDTRKLQ